MDSVKCPDCGAAICKPGREFAFCEACKAFSPIPEPKRPKLTRRDILAILSEISAVLSLLTNIINFRIGSVRSRVKGVATVAQGKATLAAKGTVTFGTATRAVMGKDAVTVTEAVRLQII